MTPQVCESQARFETVMENMFGEDKKILPQIENSDNKPL